MPCENCLSRRDFLTAAAGATGLVSLAACGDGFLSNPLVFNALPKGPVVITVSDFPALATAGTLVKVPQTSVAVKRVDATTFFGLSMVCTHQGCETAISSGPAGQRLNCPCHFSSFDANGGVVNGPNTGETIGPLAQVPTSYNAATDELTIGS